VSSLPASLLSGLQPIGMTNRQDVTGRVTRVPEYLFPATSLLILGPDGWRPVAPGGTLRALSAGPGGIVVLGIDVLEDGAELSVANSAWSLCS
jgi:hypothetical protein